MSMMSYRSLLTAAAVLTAGAFSAPTQAQNTACQFRGAPEALADRPSPLDSVAIQLGDGAAKLCYGRPSTRGRAIVGSLDPYGQPWRMGANEPTTLHVPFPIQLGSMELVRAVRDSGRDGVDHRRQLQHESVGHPDQPGCTCIGCREHKRSSDAIGRSRRDPHLHLQRLEHIRSPDICI